MRKNISSDTKSISRLFDLQRFAQNSRLETIISNVESCYARSISDEDLTYVNAAGEVEPVVPSNQNSDGTVEELQ